MRKIFVGLQSVFQKRERTTTFYRAIFREDFLRVIAKRISMFAPRLRLAAWTRALLALDLSGGIGLFLTFAIARLNAVFFGFGTAKGRRFLGKTQAADVG